MCAKREKRAVWAGFEKRASLGADGVSGRGHCIVSCWTERARAHARVSVAPHAELVTRWSGCVGMFGTDQDGMRLCSACVWCTMHSGTCDHSTKP